MTYSSMYRLTNQGIVYYTQTFKEHFIPFEELSIGYDTGDGLFRSGQLEMLEQNGGTLHSRFHLAALIEKFFPGGWDWDRQLTVLPLIEFELQNGHKLFMREHGYFTYPDFGNDYDEWEFEARIQKWLEERGYPEAKEAYKVKLEEDIQSLVYDLSKTDFIQLSPEQIKLIA